MSAPDEPLGSTRSVPLPGSGLGSASDPPPAIPATLPPPSSSSAPPAVSAPSASGLAETAHSSPPPSSPTPGPPTPTACSPNIPRIHPTHPFVDGRGDELAVRTFTDEETDLPGLTRLCEEELSEPPHLTFFVFPTPSDTEPIATIICKQALHRERTDRGYIGMLSVTHKWRRRGIARKLVELAIDEMRARGAQEIVLETEYDNAPSLALYSALGFVREKRLHRFYSNGKDAYRLILPLETHPLVEAEAERERSPHSDDQIPPEIAFALAGPASAAQASIDTQDLAQLSLDEPLRRRRPAPRFRMEHII